MVSPGDDEQEQLSISERMGRMEARVESLESSVRLSHDLHASHTRTLSEINEVLKQLRELLEAWNNTKGAFITIRFLGNAIKWIVAVAAAVMIMWAALRASVSPDVISGAPPTK